MMYDVSYIVANISPLKILVFVNTFGTIFSLIIVLIKSPIIHVNKNVNDIERKNYRKISIAICLLETVIILMLTKFFPENIIVTYMSIGQTSVALSMVAAIVKKHIIKK